MRSWKLDGTGDFVFDSNRTMQMVEDDDELVQAVRVAIQTNLGEWFINPLFGFDRFDVLGQNYDVERITDDITYAMSQVDRVDTVDDIYTEFDSEKRKLLISYVFTKVDGDQLADTVEMGV